MSKTISAVGVSDVNPYILPSGVSNLHDALRVISQEFHTAFAVDGVTFVGVDSPPTTGQMRVDFKVSGDSTVFNDFSGACFLDASGNGYYAYTQQNSLNICAVSAWSIGSPTAIATVAATWSAAADFFATFDIAGSSSILKIYQNSVSTSTPALTKTGLTYLTGMKNGIGVVRYNTGAAGIISATMTEGVTTAIDTVTTAGNPGLVVGQPFAITTTGLGTLAEVDIQTIGVLGSTVVATSLSAPSGDGTAVMPYWVNGQKYPKIGTVRVSAVETGGTPNTADGDFPLNLPANFINALFTTIVTYDSTWLGYALNAIGHPLATNDAAYWPNVNSLTFGSDSKISVDLPPGSTMTSDLWIQKVDSTMEFYTVVINSEGEIVDARAVTNRAITSRAITTRTILSRVV